MKLYDSVDCLKMSSSDLVNPPCGPRLHPTPTSTHTSGHRCAAGMRSLACWHIGAACFVALAASIPYLNSLDGKFAYDDKVRPANRWISAGQHSGPVHAARRSLRVDCAHLLLRSAQCRWRWRATRTCIARMCHSANSSRMISGATTCSTGAPTAGRTTAGARW